MARDPDSNLRDLSSHLALSLLGLSESPPPWVYDENNVQKTVRRLPAGRCQVRISCKEIGVSQGFALVLSGVPGLSGPQA